MSPGMRLQYTPQHIAGSMSAFPKLCSFQNIDALQRSNREEPWNLPDLHRMLINTRVMFLTNFFCLFLIDQTVLSKISRFQGLDRVKDKTGPGVPLYSFGRSIVLPIKSVDDHFDPSQSFYC